MHVITPTTRKETPIVVSLCAKLSSVKFGDDIQDPLRFRMKNHVLANLFQSLSMLLDNGLSIRKALATLTDEPSLTKYAWMLNGICKRLDAGQSFSTALAAYPKTFDRLIISQLQVGERSGAMNETLQRISGQFDRARDVRQRIVKRLSYPALILLAGSGLVIFMMLVVVPEFEAVFAESGGELPAMTQFVSGCSRFLYAWGWAAVVAAVVAMLVFRRFRRNERFSEWTDGLALRIPVVGRWIRDYAILQFIDTAGIMMESGFVPVEAITASVDGIRNRAVRKVISSIATALRKGQKLSKELSRYPKMFPPTVSQLVIVGEQTGNMAKATYGVRDRLRQQLESRIDAAVIVIEPFLTLVMAALIGCVVMAIYMPMFDMLEVME